LEPTNSPTKPIFDGEESWYIWIECVPTTLMMPLFIVLCGICSQALIAYFITFPIVARKNHTHDATELTIRDTALQVGSKSPKGGQSPVIDTPPLNTHCGCCLEWKKSPCGANTASALMIWQILSMLIIVILDLVSFFQWKESDYIDDTYDSSTWNNYQCFSARIVISSNYSLVIVNFVAIIMNPDWQDGFRIAWNIANGALFFCYCIWLIMYGLVGAFAYLWITIFVVGPAALVFGCCMQCKRSSPLCHQCCLQIYAPVFLMFFVSILALTMINLFEGMNYWTSFENVLLERRWEDFYNNLTAEAVFRWFTAFFG